jgi:hypothetical protein
MADRCSSIVTTGAVPRLRVCPTTPLSDEHSRNRSLPMLASTIKVAIIEDQRDIREGLAAMLKFTEGYRCTGA